MLCPQCHVALTASKRLSVEINDCPECHGIWLESSVLEQIIEQIQSIEKPEQDSHNKKRKHPLFLSASFDISDDW